MPNPSALLTRFSIKIPMLRREAGPLFLLTLVAGALWAFVELADEIGEGDARSIDEALLLSLRSEGDPTDPLGAKWVEEMARDITALGSMTVLIFTAIAAVLYLLLVGKRGAALLVVVSVGGGSAVSTVLKSFFERARPNLVPHAMETFTASFPSGHAMLSAVTWLTLGALLARLQPSIELKAYLIGLAVFISLCVGASRVYLGVHWPSDVLAGWCVGAAWALLCWLAATILQRRGSVESDISGEAEKKGT